MPTLSPNMTPLQFLAVGNGQGMLNVIITIMNSVELSHKGFSYESQDVLVTPLLFWLS
jgi:hypothetical protein